jgi:hypothetical protein
MSKHLLTFEVDRLGERIEIHADSAGLEFLIRELQRLREVSTQDHTHLMTDDWGGSGLSGERQNATSELLKHVKIFKW